jgi:hypothetical protein
MEFEIDNAVQPGACAGVHLGIRPACWTIYTLDLLPVQSLVTSLIWFQDPLSPVAWHGSRPELVVPPGRLRESAPVTHQLVSWNQQYNRATSAEQLER